MSRFSEDTKEFSLYLTTSGSSILALKCICSDENPKRYLEKDVRTKVSKAVNVNQLQEFAILLLSNTFSDSVQTQ